MRKILLILYLLFAFVYMAQSQTYDDLRVTGNSVLNVVMAWGGRSVFDTGDVKKISFSEGEMMIVDSEETTHSFDISELLSLNFRNYPVLTSVPSIVATKEQLTGLYPNPASDRLFLDSRLLDRESSRVEVLNLNGQTLIFKEITTYDYSINLSGLSPGIYICKIFSHNEVSSLKFIKQ